MHSNSNTNYNFINKSPPMKMKTLVNEIEKEWKNYGIQIQETFLNQHITRLNYELKTFVNDLENTWTSIIIQFQEKFNHIIPQLQEAVSFEYELAQKEQLFENKHIELNIDQELFENEKKKFEEMYHLPSEILELNVGGRYFSTLQSTLTNVVPDSMLSSMFSGRWPITKDINGHCYIDRDPDIFQFVLNGLRNNGHWIEPSNLDERKSLDIELDYFCLKMLPGLHEQYYQYNRIYIMGGYEGNNRIVEYLDLNTEKWVSIDHLSIERIFCTSISTNNRIYIMGGKGLSSVEYLDPIENQCHFVKSMSKPRRSHSAVYLDDDIYVMGGESNFIALNDVECYNIQNDNWIMKSPMNIPRFDFAAVVLNDEIYVMGGYNSNTRNINLAEKYNPNIINDHWIYIANMLNARYGLSAVTLQGFIYALGGSNGNKNLDSVECYNPDTNSWAYIQSMQTSRKYFAAVSAINQIYVFGGDYNNLKSVEKYNPESNEWKYITKMKQGREAFTASGFYFHDN